MRVSWGQAGALAVALSACATTNSGTSVTGTAGSTPQHQDQSTSASAHVAPEASDVPSPNFAIAMFALAFSPIGLPLGTDLRPGEFVRLKMSQPAGGAQGPASIERAHLPDDAEGNDCWRIRIIGATPAESMVIEGSFSRADHRLVRFRAKGPGDAPPHDLPLVGMTLPQGVPHLAPAGLGMQESGTVSVTVPAGTFQTHHWAFGAAVAAIEVWLSDDVPGGLVKVTGAAARPGGPPGSGTVELEAFGSDAKSEL